MNQIKALRKKNNMSQKQIAMSLHVSQPTVSEWESGKKLPSSKNARELADLFAVSIDYLLGRTEYEAPKPDPLVEDVFTSLSPEAQEVILQLMRLLAEGKR